MSTSTVAVTIVASQFTGTPLPGGKVRIEATGSDVIVGASGQIVVSEPQVLSIATGAATANLLTNTSGTQGTQYRFTFSDAFGADLFAVLATVPAYACNLHDIVDTPAPASVDAAQAAVNLAKNWASQPTGTVDGAEYSAKYYAGQAQSVLSDSGFVAVKNDLPNIDSVAGGISSVDTVASNISAVNTNAQNITAIQSASSNATAAQNAQTQAQAAANTATNQAGLAQQAAASASSVAQQDLSGVTAAALHRSPGAVTAMCIDDVSKHSDPSWPERCGNLSYLTEALNGSWLGQCATEAAARAVTGATTGSYFQNSTDGKFYSLNAGGGVTETFRGQTAKYPSAVAWVAEAQRFVAYDLTQPGRPMWMAFGATNLTDNGGFNSISATNGSLLVTSNSNVINFAIINFAKDDIRVGNNGAYIGAPVLKYRRIADRLLNTGGAYNKIGSLTFGGGDGLQIAGIPNASAMCVMADAPCDPATGLQVPTIAVATSAGVSLIQNTGTVVSSSQGGTFNNVTLNPYVLSAAGNSSANWWYTTDPAKLGASFAMTNIGPSASQWTTTAIHFDDVKAANRHTFGRRYGQAARVGLMRLNQISQAASLFAEITDAFNTGWMVGDIRRAYLCDTGVGVVNASELVTNGTFNADISGWTSTSASWQSPGFLRVSGQLFANSITSIATVPGQSYVLVFDCLASSVNGGYYRIGTTSGGSDIGSGGVAIGSAGNTVTFTARAGTTYVTLGINTSATSSADFDNVSVKSAVLDRSYKGSRLQVFGTLTRAQVNTGSQLGAISGFGPGNYLREPVYSADLDVGTGGWRIAPWCSIPALTTSAFSPVASLPAANFGVAANLPQSMDTAQWTKGTGWTCPASNSFQADGSAGAAQSDLSASSGTITAAPAAGTVRRWTVNVTALALNGGTVSIYPSSGTARNITQTGTYTFYGTTANATIRVSGGTGATISGTLQVDDLEAAPIVNRAYSAGAKYELGINILGNLVGTAYDGTTTRTVVSPGSYAGLVFFKPVLEYSTSGTLSLKVNSLPVQQTTGTPLLTLNNASAVLTVGSNYGLTSFFPGSICLLRIGAMPATYEQSACAYQDEKELFVAGAQCTLPDSGNTVDLDYDAQIGKWKVVSAANESGFVGLARVDSSPVSAGSFTHVVHRAGMKLLSRSGTNVGVDVTIPPLNAQEQFLRRYEAAANEARLNEAFDWSGQFTATVTANSTALTNVATLSYPWQASPIGAKVSGAGIPAGAYITDIQGTTVYISAPATAGANGVAISLVSFPLPAGYEVKAVYTGSPAGRRREGSGWDFTRAYDGFREQVVFSPSAPGNVNVQFDARRIAA